MKFGVLGVHIINSKSEKERGERIFEKEIYGFLKKREGKGFLREGKNGRKPNAGVREQNEF